MGYLVHSTFVEGLSKDAVRRQYIVKVRSKWRSGRPFGFDMLVETFAEAYMAAGYQHKGVKNRSRPMGDTTGAAVSRPLPMMVPSISTSTMFLSSPMPTPHLNPMPTPAAAPMVLTAPEPMNVDTIAKLREELHTVLRLTSLVGPPLRPPMGTRATSLRYLPSPAETPSFPCLQLLQNSRIPTSSLIAVRDTRQSGIPTILCW